VGTPSAITDDSSNEPSCEQTSSGLETDYGTSATNATEYHWSLSDGGAGSIDPSTGEVTWAVGFSGSVDVEVYASNCFGSSSVVTRTVTINPLPDDAGTITGFNTVCAGAPSVAYSVPAIANATSYNWSYSGSGVSFSGSTASVTASFTGGATSGDVTVTGFNACGSGGTSAAHSVTVNVCGPEPGNGLRSAATSIGSYTLGVCLSLTGDLSDKLPSPEANSTVVTGEDAWYRFIALEPGIRIEVTTSSFDGVIELQTSGGTTLDTENIVAGLGSEIMNHYNPVSPLVTGQTYYIAVRNYDSSLGNGTFTICLQKIADSGCNSGPGPYTSCNTFKAVSTNAQTYTFTFTNTTTTEETVVNSTGSTVIPLSPLVPGYDYTVDVSCTFSLNNGLGQTEVIIIEEPNSCTITMSPHADIDLRAIDSCPTQRPRNAIIGSTTWLCGAYNYNWKFEPVPSGLPFEAEGPPTNRFIALGTVPEIVAGGTYDVQIQPLFGSIGDVPGSFGVDTQCLQIIGPGGLAEEAQGNMAENGERNLIAANGLETSLYPNPSNGNLVTLNISGVEGNQVSVRILNATGSIVFADRYTVDGSLNKIINFERALASGLYMMEMTVDNQMITERFVVSR
jgi:hypothetical protein